VALVVSDQRPIRGPVGATGIRGAVLAALETILRPYGLIVFSRGLVPGLLMLLGISVFPRLALATLASVVIAAATTALLGYGTAAVRGGGYGCTAVLTTLAIGVFAPEGGNPYLLVVAGAVVSVLMTGALDSLLRTVALPAHSLPFVVSTWLVHLASRSLPSSAHRIAWLDPAAWLPAGWLAPSFLDMSAAIVFLQGALPGLLVLGAVLVHSRIAFVLAAIGSVVPALVHVVARAGEPWSILDTTASFNGIITAIAVGGIWFVPHPSSLGLAGVASALAAGLTYALFPAAGILGLPVVSLPFVLSVHVVLAAARQRERDRHPQSVATPAERPEDALDSHLGRVRQLGTGAVVRLNPPFRGEWFTSQGFDGSDTHRGPWRHGLDFEIRDLDGSAFEHGGSELSDYRCYGLPVLSSALGTVALVADGVPDNRPGQINTTENWGNAVVIAHGLAHYSVYAHLQSGSIRVKVGDVVAAGVPLGKCGNSGRSATPHLHFQIQRDAALGSPTLPFELVHVVSREGDCERIRARHVPAEQSRVRPIVPDEAVRRAFELSVGAELSLVAASGEIERAMVSLDLLGNTVVKSDQARLAVRQHAAGMLVVDFRGSRRSLLRHLVFALGNVWFDQAQVLGWEDALPTRLLLPAIGRELVSAASAVLPSLGETPVRYRCERQNGTLAITAEGKAFRAKTRLTLSSGMLEIEVDRGARSASLTLVRVPRAERRAA